MWRTKKQKCKLSLIFVYGPAHEDRKEQFLLELAQVCHEIKSPCLIGGDFNILRFSTEKNKNFHKNRWSDILNNIINTNELREVYLNCGKFT